MANTPLTLDISTIMILFGLLQAVLIMVVFIHRRGFAQHAFFILNLAVLVYIQFHSFLVHAGWMAHLIFLFNSATPMLLLLGPFIALYSYKTIGIAVSPTRRTLHFVPFIGYFIYSFNFFLQDSSYKLFLLAKERGVTPVTEEYVKNFPVDPWGVQGWVVVELISLHLVSYGAFTLFKIYQHQKTHSSKHPKSTIHWLQFLSIILVLGGIVLFLSQGGVVNGYVFLKTPFPAFAPDLFGSLVMYSIALYLMVKSDLLTFKRAKYHKSTLRQDFIKEKVQVVQQMIEGEKLYLSPEFSLDLLASKTGLSRHHISQMINAELQCTFSELTNQYRVQEAKERLAQEEFVKIEQLAYQLGYKSKSTFFNVFKKHTNLTPAQYRNSRTM
ncbi:MAG TPA: hypothetical protein DCS93_40295 [Microscillaceae bacterium]|nr:hypothetical protein [Microscillaceae bacterium]